MDEQVDTLEKALRWIAHHQGEVMAWWHSQWKFNERLEEEFEALRRDVQKDIRNLMLKLIAIIGIVAAAGAAFGAYIGGS